MPHEDAIGTDPATVAYFDDYAPEYSVGRLEFAADVIRRRGAPGASLIDLGCGVGNTLAYVKETTQVGEIAGLDVSAKCLEKTAARLDCATYQGSVFDPAFIREIDRRFDFVVVAAVLHHLIGPTRNASRSYARMALRNAVAMLEPGGHLIVVEPIFYPSLAMDAVFYLKKAVSRVSARRIPIMGYWNNIGAPVVSYYTNEELATMLAGAGALTIVEQDIQDAPMGPLLGRLLRKTNTTMVARLATAA
jgi:SAM-dependent methyltransferase